MSHYLGHWKLIPELSHYSAGSPPESGDYILEQEGGRIVFTVRWDMDGTENEAVFAAPPDGRPVASDFPGIDTFTVLHEDDRTLSGEALADGQVVSRAVRRASEDGELLSVLQENADGEGGWIRIFQVYRRAD